jgi:hypothetical protein
MQTEVFMPAGKVRQRYFTAGQISFGFYDFCQTATDDVLVGCQVKIFIQQTGDGLIDRICFWGIRFMIYPISLSAFLAYLV